MAIWMISWTCGNVKSLASRSRRQIGGWVLFSSTFTTKYTGSSWRGSKTGCRRVHAELKPPYWCVHCAMAASAA